MLLLAMLVDADHAALEDGEITLCTVHANDDASPTITIGVFLAAMVNGAVLRKFLADADILGRLISHQVCFSVDIRLHDRADDSLGNFLDMERTSRPAPLDKAKDDAL